MTRKVFALMFFAATFVVAVNAQRFGTTTCGLTPGPCAERDARQGYTPVDYMINNYGYGGYGYGYGGYGNGRLGTNIAVSAVAGLAGGLIANAISNRHDNREREYVPSSNGGRAYYAYNDQSRQVVLAAPKPQKPLDCRKPAGKRGKNEVACETAEQELAAQQRAFERQACLERLAASKWFVRNASDTFPFTLTVKGKPMVTCSEVVEVPPLGTISIFEPAADDSIGGRSAGAVKRGRKEEFNADVQPLNRPGFRGFVLWPPEPPRGKEN